MPAERIARLWEHMTALYGCRWAVEYGYATSETGELEPLARVWATALADLPDAGLAAGLRKLLARESPHPPTLPEFLRMCGARLTPMPAPGPYLPPLPSSAYADSPSQRVAKLAAELSSQARTELQPRVAQMLPQDQPNATRSYWLSKISAVMAGKSDEVLPDGWRDAAGMPEPEKRESKPGDIPAIGESMRRFSFG